MALRPGTRLGPYEVLESAGVGGMGEVYKARDVRLGRTVALKTLSAGFEGDPAARSRLAREARAVAALNHPHIGGIHDVGEWEGQTYLVMEFLEGETLQQRLGRGPLPLAELLTAAIQIASALVAAHRQGIIHRDLKPSNVMLTRTGVKLLDFGIAKQRTPSNESPTVEATVTDLATLPGQFIGTLPYMAPEQLEGKPVDARADIFAFGAVLFEMATARRPFDGTSPAALVAAILSDSRPSAAGIVPRPIERVISVCLAKDPDDRCQHSADLLHELKWVQEDLSHSDNRTAQGAPRSSWAHWATHAIWLAALFAAVAVVWFSASRRGPAAPAPNPVPVIVLMDSPLPGRVYDPRTAAAGGTNADDVTDLLRDLSVVIRKENTSAVWHREEQVVAENPDLIVTHLSCLFDARIAKDQGDVYDHLFRQAEDRLLLFLAYVAARNPRTHFIVYSRTVFQTRGGEAQWVRDQEARLPVLRGRLRAFTVPGGTEHASFRDAETGRLLRERVVQVLAPRTH